MIVMYTSPESTPYVIRYTIAVCDCVVVLRIRKTAWARYTIATLRGHIMQSRDYVTQSRDCVNVKIAWNIYVPSNSSICAILKLHCAIIIEILKLPITVQGRIAQFVNSDFGLVPWPRSLAAVPQLLSCHHKPGSAFFAPHSQILLRCLMAPN